MSKSHTKIPSSDCIPQPPPQFHQISPVKYTLNKHKKNKSFQINKTPTTNPPATTIDSLNSTNVSPIKSRKNHPQHNPQRYLLLSEINKIDIIQSRNSFIKSNSYYVSPQINQKLRKNLRLSELTNKGTPKAQTSFENNESQIYTNA